MQTCSFKIKKKKHVLDSDKGWEEKSSRGMHNTMTWKGVTALERSAKTSARWREASRNLHAGKQHVREPGNGVPGKEPARTEALWP